MVGHSEPIKFVLSPACENEGLLLRNLWKLCVEFAHFNVKVINFPNLFHKVELSKQIYSAKRKTPSGEKYGGKWVSILR